MRCGAILSVVINLSHATSGNGSRIFCKKKRLKKRERPFFFFDFMQFIFQSKNMKTKYNKSQLITNQNVLKFMALTTWSWTTGNPRLWHKGLWVLCTHCDRCCYIIGGVIIYCLSATLRLPFQCSWCALTKDIPRTAEKCPWSRKHQQIITKTLVSSVKCIMLWQCGTI